jgi:hypothetical protein
VPHSGIRPSGCIPSSLTRFSGSRLSTPSRRQCARLAWRGVNQPSITSCSALPISSAGGGMRPDEPTSGQDAQSAARRIAHGGGSSPPDGRQTIGDDAVPTRYGAVDAENAGRNAFNNSSRAARVPGRRATDPSTINQMTPDHSRPLPEPCRKSLVRCSSALTKVCSRRDLRVEPRAPNGKRTDLCQRSEALALGVAGRATHHFLHGGRRRLMVQKGYGPTFRRAHSRRIASSRETPSTARVDTRPGPGNCA